MHILPMSMISNDKLSKKKTLLLDSNLETFLLLNPLTNVYFFI